MDDNNPHSPLNQAHCHARVADSYEKSGKFDEACKYHQKAVDFLKDSAQISTFTSTKESILLQIEYHQRQEQIIALKRIQYLVKQKILAQKAKQLTMDQNVISSKKKDDTLEWAIYKNIEAADSLIEALAERESNSLNDCTESSSAAMISNAVKHPKGDSTVIEELHTLNNKLRELISQLLSQLEESQKETDSLRAKVKYYEESSHKQKDEPTTREQNLIDFNSMSSSEESIGIIP